MKRVFHLFETPTPGKQIIGLVENGIPKAMAIINMSWEDIETEEEAEEFSNQAIMAFGKKVPMTDEQKEQPWVD